MQFHIIQNYCSIIGIKVYFVLFKVSEIRRLTDGQRLALRHDVDKFITLF